MAKQGMKRPEFKKKKNEAPPVPEINGKAKHGGSHAEDDLATENMMNDFDMTAADLQDFRRET